MNRIHRKWNAPASNRIYKKICLATQKFHTFYGFYATIYLLITLLRSNIKRMIIYEEVTVNGL
jgi:hypothetical protein